VGRRVSVPEVSFAGIADVGYDLPKVKFIYSLIDMACMAKVATVSSKGQITLPKELRERHHLREGEKVVLLDAEDGILVKHARPRLRGLLRGKIDGKGFEEDLRTLRREWTL